MGLGALNSFRRLFTYAFLACLLVGGALFISNTAHAVAGINQQINFQGRLLNSQGATVPDGYYNIEFKIYQDGTGQAVGNPGGTLKWTESHLNNSSQGVLVKNGFMSVQLGSVNNTLGTAVDWNQDTLWLSMNIASTNGSCTPFASCTPDGEMAPMKRMSSTPYALNAGSVGGLSTAQLIQNTTTLQTANIAIQSSAATNIGALVQGAASQTADIFQIKADGIANPLIKVASNGAVTLQNTADSTTAFRVLDSGSGLVLGVDTSNNLVRVVTGTVNTATLASGTGALQIGADNTDNLAFDDNEIMARSSGSASTLYLQKLGGGLNIQATSTLIKPNSNSTTAFQIQPSSTSTPIFNVDSTNSRVGIGMDNPAYKLDVSSDINTSTQYRIGGNVALTSSSLAFNAASSASIQSAAGQSLTIQGGNAVAANTNGGSLTLVGGAGTGTGISGLVNLGASAYTSITNAVCSANCTITQSNVDSYGTVIINASVAGITITLPPPTNTTTAGRIVYLTTASGSQDFTLSTNSGASTVDVAMRQNTTATMIWNGTAWTPGGASNATTLQATYDNGANPSSTPEIKLDSVRGTIDIQDADTSIGQDLFNIRGSNAAGLGTVLFGVSDNGSVTIQNTADQASSFRVLNASGEYVMNINSSNNYIINNSVTSPGNAIANPSFETGGAITSGEEGWFGPAQAAIVSDSANAHAGNYEMLVAPSATNMDIYAGSYYEVKPGDSLYLEGWVKNSAGADGTAGIQITWYDKDKSNPTYSTDYATLPGTSYILKKVNATVPAGKYYARVSATVRSTATTGTFYFDDFYMKKSTESAPYTFRNSSDSTAAFTIQSASSAQTLFAADTANNVLKVGDSTGSDTQTTLLVLDSATADPSSSLASKNGGLFYRSDTNSLKAVVGGVVVDVCTTAVTCSGYSASASSTIQLQGSSPGSAQIGNFNITGVGILTQLQTQDQSAASTNSSNLVIRTGNATGASSNSGNLILDTGTATGVAGTITIGHSGVATTMAGTLAIQGSNTLALGAGSSATGSIQFKTAAGGNTVTLQGPGANPTASYTLTLPQNLGSSGDCLKDNGSGALGFGNCSAGITVNLQDTYNNSATPATVTLADAKNLQFTAQDTTTDPNVLVNLQCVTACGSNGRFSVQNNGSDIFTVSPNSAGITLGVKTQVGSGTTDASQINLQLDSYNGATDSGTCTTTANQGSMYYNSSMGTIRACINGNWSDISNPEPLGLLSYGVVPASGANPYDLPALSTTGASGPCKVSWVSTTQVTWQPCVAYSGGQRVSVAAPGSPLTVTGSTNQVRHLCLTGAGGQPALSNAGTGIQNMPTFSVSAPTLCLADVKISSTTANVIGQIYDTRTFTSSLKEAVPASTAVELGMLTDASGTNGAMVPSVASSQKMYGLVVASNGSTSTTTPNVIVTTVGPGWVKATSGTAGQFIKASGFSGYGDTITSIPNNSFYYSAGNTRTSFSATCSAASNCSGSLYVNFIVR